MGKPMIIGKITQLSERQPDLFHRPEPVPYRRESATSRQAAERISQEPQLREGKRQRLLAAYVSSGARGLTDAEASEATQLPRSSICSLRASLIKAGLVMDGYTRRPGPWGYAQMVFVTTTAGREASR
jgi:hypothetical protein